MHGTLVEVEVATYGGCFSPSIIWVPGIELKSSDLMAGAFTY